MVKALAGAAAAAVLWACSLSEPFASGSGREPGLQRVKEIIDVPLTVSSETIEYPGESVHYVDTASPVVAGGNRYYFSLYLDLRGYGPGEYRFTQKDFHASLTARSGFSGAPLDIGIEDVEYRIRPATFILTITKNASKQVRVTVTGRTCVYGEPFKPSISVSGLSGKDADSVKVTGFTVDGLPAESGSIIEAGVHSVSCSVESGLYSDLRVIEGELTVHPRTQYAYAGSVPEGAPAPPGPGSASFGAVCAFPKVYSPDGYNFSGWSSADAKAVPGGFTVAADCPSVIRFTGTWTAQAHSLVFVFEGTPLASFTLRTGEATGAAAETAVKSVPAPGRGFEFSGWENLPDVMPASDLLIGAGHVRVGYVASFIVDGRETGWSLLQAGDAVVPVGTESLTAGLEEGQYLKWEDYPALMPEHDIEISGVVVTVYTTQAPARLEKSLCALNILFSMTCLSCFMFSSWDIFSRGQHRRPFALLLSAVPVASSGFMLCLSVDFAHPLVTGDALTPAFAVLALMQIIFSVTLSGIPASAGRVGRIRRRRGIDEAHSLEAPGALAGGTGELQ